MSDDRPTHPREEALWIFRARHKTIYVLDIHWFPAEVEFVVENPQGNIVREDTMSLRSWARMMEKDPDIHEAP